MKIPDCFSFLGCLEVTLVLRDFKTVTGKIVGGLDGRKYGDYDKHDDCKKDEDYKHDDCKKDWGQKHDDCKKDDSKSDFILIELTEDAQSVSLLEVESEESDEIEIKLANVEFEKGKCILVNVNDIIYAGVDAEIKKEEIEIELPDGIGLSNPIAEEPTK